MTADARPRAHSTALRVVLCVLLWLLPFVATWVAHRLSAAEGSVNMFGMTEQQHRATLITLALSAGVTLLLCAVLRVGYLWLLVSLVLAVAIALVLGLVGEHLVEVPRIVASLCALILAPAAAAVLTARRQRA